jgi:hypothetical protein
MAHFYKTLALLFALMPLSLLGQMDTLLHEDFQDQTLEPEEVIFPSGDDTTWVNWDADFLEDANARPQEWFIDISLTQAFADTIAAADTNFVLASSSWLAGFLPGNRNWLITPPIEILDDQATFHWKSAPRQGPRYVDGYSVLVTTGDNFFGSADTLFRAAQMIEPLPNGSGDAEINAFNVDSFNFAPADGYIHADRYTLGDYFFLEDSTSTAYVGILEPHSVSLAAYEGQTIYLAIVHDSDDDNYIIIDDLLLMGTEVVSSTENPVANDIRLVTYPNPVTNFFNILFRLENQAQGVLELYNQNGQLVRTAELGNLLSGEHTVRLNLASYPAGSYSVVLKLDGQVYTRQLIKQ